MASTPIVFKVKYETILKRFCISIVDKKLDLDLAMLKDKICRLFSLVSNADLTMTYVDEDGDAVSLDTDDELHEAVRQNLKPIRITINLNRGSRYHHNFPKPFLFNNPAYGDGGGGGLQTKPENTNNAFSARLFKPLPALSFGRNSSAANDFPFK